jgi:hypothetical protein
MITTSIFRNFDTKQIVTDAPDTIQVQTVFLRTSAVNERDAQDYTGWTSYQKENKTRPMPDRNLTTGGFNESASKLGVGIGKCGRHNKRDSAWWPSYGRNYT